MRFPHRDPWTLRSHDTSHRLSLILSRKKARIVWRRGGNNALGVVGAPNAPPGWTRVCSQSSPFWWGTNATKQYLERRGLEVMAASMSPPRTKAQGWLLLAKSDTKDLEQDDFWLCGEHDITCRKREKNLTRTPPSGQWQQKEPDGNAEMTSKP